MHSAPISNPCKEGKLKIQLALFAGTENSLHIQDTLKVSEKILPFIRVFV